MATKDVRQFTDQGRISDFPMTGTMSPAREFPCISIDLGGMGALLSARLDLCTKDAERQYTGKQSLNSVASEPSSVRQVQLR